MIAVGFCLLAIGLVCAGIFGHDAPNAPEWIKVTGGWAIIIGVLLLIAGATHWLWVHA